MCVRFAIVVCYVVAAVVGIVEDVDVDTIIDIVVIVVTVVVIARYYCVVTVVFIVGISDAVTFVVNFTHLLFMILVLFGIPWFRLLPLWLVMSVLLRL